MYIYLIYIIKLPSGSPQAKQLALKASCCWRLWFRQLAYVF